MHARSAHAGVAYKMPPLIKMRSDAQKTFADEKKPKPFVETHLFARATRAATRRSFRLKAFFRKTRSNVSHASAGAKHTILCARRFADAFYARFRSCAARLRSLQPARASVGGAALPQQRSKSALRTKCDAAAAAVRRENLQREARACLLRAKRPDSDARCETISNRSSRTLMPKEAAQMCEQRKRAK